MQMPAFLARFTMKQQLVEPEAVNKAISPLTVPALLRIGQQPQSPALLVTMRHQMKEPIS